MTQIRNVELRRSYAIGVPWDPPKLIGSPADPWICMGGLLDISYINTTDYKIKKAIFFKVGNGQWGKKRPHTNLGMF